MEPLGKRNSFEMKRLSFFLVIILFLPSCTTVFKDVIRSEVSAMPPQRAEKVAEQFTVRGFRIEREPRRIVLVPRDEKYKGSFVSVSYDSNTVVVAVETIGPNSRKPRSHTALKGLVESSVSG